MSSLDELITRKKGKNLPKQRKSEHAKADPSEDGCTYCIDRVNLGKSANDSERKSDCILVQRRKGHISYKINKDNSIKHECNA